jgi:hypothetical protein
MCERLNKNNLKIFFNHFLGVFQYLLIYEEVSKLSQQLIIQQMYNRFYYQFYNHILHYHAQQMLQ